MAEIVLSGTVRKRIDEFVGKFPDSSYGPAHIVLDDNNVFDDNISFCLQECQDWLSKARGDKVEIQNTEQFLKELLDIPEDDRFEEDKKQ